MAIKMVTYELDNYNQDYPLIRLKLRSFRHWVRVMERVWIVISKRDADVIAELLLESIGGRGKIFVIDVNVENWAGLCLDEKVEKWLKKHLDK